MAEATRGDTGSPDLKADLHQRAMDHANEAWGQEWENVDSGRDCQRFYIGGTNQWDADAAQRRKDANRPVLTINRAPSFVRQFTGEVRQNPAGIKVLPAKGKATKEAAEIFSGLIRHIEQQSLARAAYTKGAENAAKTGQGAWRVVVQYSADDAFEQDIRIKRINDPFSVLIDPLAQEPDKSDMRYGFIFQDITQEEFKRRYPKAVLESMPTNIGDQSLSWRTVKTVKIAEYWYREPRKRVLQMHENGSVDYADEAKENPNPSPVVQTREVAVEQIKSCICSGAEILEGPFDWAGRYIPIVVVVGEEDSLDGRVVRKGMIHDMRDPQKVYNYTRTAAVEAVAMQPKAPFVATVSQIAGLEDQWAKAGTDNVTVLTYNPDAKAPGAPQRSAPPIASQGLDVQSQIAVDDLKGVTGIFNASLGQEGNETSGRAIVARQREGDTGTYHLVDNLGIGIYYTGKILVDLIPRIYDSTRIVRTLGEDDSAQMVEINSPQVNESGEEIVLNDLSAGEYDVVVSTGPSYATKRAEATAFVTELVRSFPQMAQVAGDIMVENMDVPGADKIAARLKQSMGLDEEGNPIDKPQQQDPGAAAKALKDAADADKTRAETEGQEIKNAADFVALQQMMMQVGQQMTALQQGMQQMMAMQQGGQQPAPGASTPEPPPQAPPEMNDAQIPTIELGNDDAMPPSVEIGNSEVNA
jgi:hypothetical protein